MRLSRRDPVHAGAGNPSTSAVVRCPPMSIRAIVFSTYEFKSAHRKYCRSSSIGVRRQKRVCVVTTWGGTIAATSDTRLATPDTSR